MNTNYNNFTNTERRVMRTQELIDSSIPSSSTGHLLDVGAGEGPFRDYILRRNLSYSSHDFCEYQPNDSSGLQNKSWIYQKVDYQCDVLDIPEEEKFSIVLLTEVLEHVPNPIAVLKKSARLLEPGGWLIFSVPLLSLQHQAPYWFQSGLSQDWFRYWFRRAGFGRLEIETIGDFEDLIGQEIARLLRGFNGNRVSRFLLSRMAGFFETKFPSIIRGKIPQDLSSAGGFTVIGRAQVTSRS